MALPRTSLPAVAVVVVAVLWGVTFTVTAEALTELPPAHLVLLRFGFAAGLLRLLTRAVRAFPQSCGSAVSFSACCSVEGSCCRPGPSD